MFLFCLSPLLLSAGEINKTIDAETKLTGWKITDNNFQLELIQRSPQQTRSFFQARGFSTKIANDIATHCVLQTIIRNTEAQNPNDSITISLKEWRMTNSKDTKERTLKLKEVWDKEWKDGDITNAARIAFRWATFPTEQTFDPGGDYNWGMISFGLKPDTLFDLHIFWKQGNNTHDAWIKDMQCPPDRPE